MAGSVGGRGDTAWLCVAANLWPELALNRVCPFRVAIEENAKAWISMNWRRRVPEFVTHTEDFIPR